MPVLRKPHQYTLWSFDAALLERLSNLYDLGTFTGFRPILLDGDYCTLIDVRSQTSRKMVLENSNGTRLFLKELPWYCDRAVLPLATQWQVKLLGEGLPVPRLHCARDGRAWVDLDGLVFTLADYVLGDRYVGTSTQLRATGVLLAQVHAHSDGLPDSPKSDAFTDAYDHITLARTHDTARPHEVFLDALANLVTASEELALREGWRVLGDQYAHGDINPWNLLYTHDDEVAALIDFDNAHQGPSIRDLAEAIITFSSIVYREDTTNFAAQPPSSVNHAAAAAILSGYTSARPLNKVERNCLPPMARAVAVELACLGLIRGDYTWDHASALHDWVQEMPTTLAELVNETP